MQKFTSTFPNKQHKTITISVFTPEFLFIIQKQQVKHNKYTIRTVKIIIISNSCEMRTEKFYKCKEKSIKKPAPCDRQAFETEIINF